MGSSPVGGGNLELGREAGTEDSEFRNKLEGKNLFIL